jgi:tight adherence protein B
MLIAVLLAVTLVRARHWMVPAVLAVALLAPIAFLVGAGGWAAHHARRSSRARRRLPGAEADFLRAVAAEVEAGASVRQALIAAAGGAPELDLARAVHLAAAGRPADEVVAALREALPLNGRMAGAAYQLVSDTGGRAAAVFAALAVRAADAGDIERERRALSAQARLSAWLVGGLPAGVTVAMALAGRGPSLHGASAVISILGVGLIVIGGAGVALMVRET